MLAFYDSLGRQENPNVLKLHPSRGPKKSTFLTKVTFTSIDAQKAIAFPTISLDIELKVITEEVD